MTGEAPEAVPDDTVAIATLFPRVVACTVAIFVVLTAVRGHADAQVFALGTAHLKVWDRAAFAGSLVAAAVLTLRFLRHPSTAPGLVALLVSVGGLLWGALRIERPALSTQSWTGFGTSVVLVALPVAVLIVPVTRWIRRSRALSTALGFLAAALAVVDALSLIRTLGDFSNAFNNDFVLNEMLAPAAGRVPYSNFVPQYTALYGWIVAPFGHVLSAHGLAQLSMIVLSCLGILAVGLAVILARLTLPGRSMWLAAGLTVPLATVTVLHGVISSSLAAYLQELPIRMFPVMLYSLLAVGSLVALLEQSLPRARLILLGTFAGLMAWNSQDFGVAVTVTYGVMLLVATRGVLRRRAALLWLAGLVPGAVLYPLLTLIAGHPIQLRYLALTARSFGGGFASEPVQVPGPVLLVVPVLVGSAAVGWCLLRRASVPGSSPQRPRHQTYALVTLAFVGAWSVACLPYYLNLSSASGQLQTFLLPFGVCCCALLSLCRPSAPAGARLVPEVRSHLRKGALWLLPATLPVGVALGAVLQTPDPSVALHALTHPPPSAGFLATVDETPIRAGEAYARAHGGGAVGYLGQNADYVKLSTGARPRMLYDDQADFGLSEAAHRLGCEFVRHHATPWLVVTSSALSYVGPGMCGVYQPLTVPDESPDTLFRLRTR
jgi:hypothetical protein